MSPYFSIVIPTFNRAGFVERALNSCLVQTFADWEAVVVDDGSTDRSAEIVPGLQDKRIQLVRHDRNRGVCPARNTGVSRSLGDWILFLDSDDEFLPGALGAIRSRTETVAPEVFRLVFAYQVDTGGLSPDPPLQHEIWDYRRYIEWMESGGSRTDFLNCIRREAFTHVTWPENRALEGLFHFEFSCLFKTECHPESVAILHTDAPNRSAGGGAARRLEEALDAARAAEQLLSRHGEALKNWAPSRHQQFLRGAATLHFLAGQRAKGVRYLREFLRARPLALSGWAILALGLIGSRTVVAAQRLAAALRAKGFVAEE